MTDAAPSAPVRDFDALRDSLMASDLSPLEGFGRGVWIHGAGGFGRKLARLLAGVGVPVLGFIDRRGDELARIDGLRVLHPDAMTDGDVASARHLHGLMNDTTPSAEITEWAASRGFAGLLFPTDLYRIAGVALEHYWLGPRSATLQNLASIEAVHDALADDESRRILRSLLRYRLHADPRLHPATDRRGSYAPGFLPIFDQPITFVDGGAYTGDTAEALLDHGVIIADWIAFEPDRDNFTRLRETARRCHDRLGAYTLLCLGLSDSNERLAFADGAGAASRIAAKDVAGTIVDVVRADDIVKRRGPLYVKLDVEGAELAALRGMPNLLDQRPVLAVSIYHRPQDLWEIPLYLMERRRDAGFFIRQHGYHAFDTVLYMVER